MCLKRLLGLTAAVLEVDEGIHKRNSQFGGTTTLTISNKKVKDIMTIFKSLE